MTNQHEKIIYEMLMARKMAMEKAASKEWEKLRNKNRCNYIRNIQEKFIVEIDDIEELRALIIKHKQIANEMKSNLNLISWGLSKINYKLSQSSAGTND